MRPIISIITSTFNLEKYIDNCIGSVIGQTYQYWEMIIVDDASTDSTCDIIKKYQERDNRIKLIEHKRNWGVEKLKYTYNQALSRSIGKYIAILEGDDYWPPNKLERQLKLFNDKGVVLSFGDCIYIDGENKGFEIVSYGQYDYKELQNTPIGSILNLFVHLNFYLIPVTVLIRKSALLKIGGFQNSPYYYFVDFPTWLNLAIIGRFAYEREIMGFWRRHKDSFWLKFSRKTSSLGREEMQKTFIDFVNKRKRLLSRRNIILSEAIIKKIQKKLLNKKKKHQHLSYLFHHFTYGKKRDVKNDIALILTSNQVELKWKILSFCIYGLLPFREVLIYVYFQLRLLIYKLI